jgi:UDP-N-acetylmuramate dehydrogenase
MNDIKAKRNDTQPIREKTGGSTFANPSVQELRIAGLPDDTKAWQVVEKVGGRGLMRGGAQISEKHCNFMINTGDASASDLEGLGDEIITRAHDQFGLKLRWEIKRIGRR